MTTLSRKSQENGSETGKKKTFRQSLHYSTWMSQKNCGPHPESQEQRPRGEPGLPLAWPSQALKPPRGGRGQINQAMELELSSPTSRHASSSSSTVSTQTPHGAWISAHTRHAPISVNEVRRGLTESRDPPRRQQVRPRPPRIRGGHVGAGPLPHQQQGPSPLGCQRGATEDPGRLQAVTRQHSFPVTSRQTG